VAKYLNTHFKKTQEISGDFLMTGNALNKVGGSTRKSAYLKETAILRHIKSLN